MDNTLSYGPTTVTLPADLSWPDEYGWVALEQRREYTVTGALVIETAVRQAGRPITLRGHEGRAWMLRSVVNQLQAWALLPGATFTLVIRGATFTVTFDHVGGAIEARPVYDEATQEAGDHYIVALRFIEV